MQLINAKIVPAGQNVFWEALPETWRSLTPRTCLVLTTPYSSQSAEEQTLLKMLGACRLTPGQYHILMLQPDQQVAWHQLRHQLQPHYILLLGINPAALGISALFRLNEPNAFQECTFIPSLSLDALDQRREAKTALWAQGLKPLFVP